MPFSHDDFSARLVAARKAAGLTQTEVAEALTRDGAPTIKQTVSHWETKRSQPDLDMLYRLRGLYRISLDALLTGVDRWPFDAGLLDQVLALDTNRRAQVEGAVRLVLGQLDVPQTDQAAA